MKVVCSCIVGESDCPYCHGTNVVEVELIGSPYPDE